MRMVNQLAMGLLGVLVALGSVGCETKPRLGEYTVTVTLADGFTPVGALEVDLVGVADGPVKTAIEQEPVSSYFRAMGEFRTSLDRRIPLVFRPEGERSQTVDLTRRGPYHNDWKAAGVMHLAVLARLDEPTGPDLRRVVLPLDKARWNTTRIRLVIDSNKITADPAPLPPKQ